MKKAWGRFLRSWKRKTFLDSEELFFFKNFLPIKDRNTFGEGYPQRRYLTIAKLAKAEFSTAA